jgi:hypothetical protein
MSHVTDSRSLKELGYLTFSGYKAGQVRAELARCLRTSLLEESLYWSAELACSGKSPDAWDAISLVCAESVFAAAPSVVSFVSKQAARYKQNANAVGDVLSLRNDTQARQLLAACAGAVCGASLRPRTRRVVVKKHEFTSAHAPHRLKAPNVEYARGAFTSSDPTELYVAANELAYALSDASYDAMHAAYWVEWALGYTRIRKAAKRPLSCTPRANMEGKVAEHPVWLLWEIVERAAKSTGLESVGDLKRLFALKFTPGAAGKRAPLLYCAVACCAPGFDPGGMPGEAAAMARLAASTADNAYATVLKKSGRPAETKGPAARNHKQQDTDYERKFALLSTAPGFTGGH